jgi:pyridoxine kinase
MHVLSITSHVSFGHVGAQAMALPLQRLGHDVSFIPTVLLSNHPAYGQAGGGPVKLVRLHDIAGALLAQGLADDCAALHCGYLGQSGTDAIVINALSRIRAHNENAIFLCDPIMGDDGRLYVEAELVDRIRERLVPEADIITPNRYELAMISGRAISTLDDVEAACAELAGGGQKRIVCTSAQRDGPDLLIYGVDADGGFIVRSPYLENAPFGTGDAFSAVLLGRLLNGSAFAEATALAAASAYGLIRSSHAAGSFELDVVGGQGEVTNPSDVFSIERRSS